MNIYQQHGYNNRQHYLLKMSEHYQLPFNTVCKIADIIGKDKDFNGLEDLLFIMWKTIRERIEGRMKYEENMEMLKRRYNI